MIMISRLLSALLSLTPAVCPVLTAGAPPREPFPVPAGIKGLQVQMPDDAIALGIHHAAVNVNLNGLLDTAKDPENPKRRAGTFEFSFNRRYLESLDRSFKPLSDRGIVCYAILIAYRSGQADRDAVVIHPGSRTDGNYSVGGFNSVTEEGRAYLQAVMELLGERWGGASAEHGRVRGWIVGNEVNSHWMWYNMGKAELPEAVRHYEEAFRIVHRAVSRSPLGMRLYIPLDHHWAVGMHGVSAAECAPGRDFLDAFARRVRENGDLEWHVAAHPYPEDLGNPRAWADRGVTFDDNSPKVTFKNLEVLCRHMERPELAWQGQPRRVILSEQGFHTLDRPDGGTLQAAAYAYAWEKCRRLPLIDAFIYHRHVDHSGEGGLRLGLWSNKPGSVADPGAKKQIYELFLKAGTPDWDAAAAFALPVTGLSSWDRLAPRETPEKGK